MICASLSQSSSTVRLAAKRQEGLELCEGLFDGIEIGAVRRQILQGSADSFNGFAHAGNFMGRQIVHNHHITGRQGRRELLLDISHKGIAIHRAIKNQRRAHP